MLWRCYLVISVVFARSSCFAKTFVELDGFESKLLEAFKDLEPKADNDYEQLNVPDYYKRRENVTASSFMGRSSLSQLKYLESKFEAEVLASTKRIPGLVIKKINERLASLTRTSSRAEAVHNFKKCFDSKFNDLITCDVTAVQTESIIPCLPIRGSLAWNERKDYSDETVNMDNRKESSYWVTSSWSKCKSHCGPQMQIRKAICVTKTGRSVSDMNCEGHRKPSMVRECNHTTQCTTRWYASEWSECSSKQGEGLRTRHVVCLEFDGEQLHSVMDPEKCNPQTMMPDNETCSGGEIPMNEWYTSDFGECSKTCGGGFRKRRVFCFKNDTQEMLSNCNFATMPFEKEMCNTHSCTEDELMDLTGVEENEFLFQNEDNQEEIVDVTMIDQLFKSIKEHERKNQLSSRSEGGSELISGMGKVHLMTDMMERQFGKRKNFWFKKVIVEGSGGSPIPEKGTINNLIITGSPMEKLFLNYMLIRNKLKDFTNLWKNVFKIG